MRSRGALWLLTGAQREQGRRSQAQARRRLKRLEQRLTDPGHEGPRRRGKTRRERSQRSQHTIGGRD
eukprot:scaffold332_cov105-Isochrysis_galbana.AAC.2